MLNFDPVSDTMGIESFPSARRLRKRKVPDAHRGQHMPAPPQLVGATVRHDNNQMIFSEGDEAKHFYKVVAGRVRLCKMRCDGRRQIIEFLVPGDLFGFEFGREHRLTAEAIGKSVLERYAFQQIERLSEEQPDIRRQLTTMLRYNLSAVQHHMMMLGRETAKQRVASFLASFASRFGITRSGVLYLGMGRQDIADYVGLALETVCRELGVLQREGLIKILDHRRVTICSVSALRSLSEGR